MFSHAAEAMYAGAMPGEQFDVMKDTSLGGFFSSFSDSPATGGRLNGRFYDLNRRSSEAASWMKDYGKRLAAGEISMSEYSRLTRDLVPFTSVRALVNRAIKAEAMVKSFEGKEQRRQEEYVARLKREAVEAYRNGRGE
jgi:hypothetical protein